MSCVPGPARNVHPPGRASGRPIAFTATARAAMTYCSMNDGDTCSAAAMLSKPSTTSSAGSTAVGVEFDGQEIANRVRVFLAIEPVQDDLVGHVRLRGAAARSSEPLEPGDQRIGGRGVGLLGSGRRHDAAAQLAHGLLEHVGVLADAVRA